MSLKRYAIAFILGQSLSWQAFASQSVMVNVGMDRGGPAFGVDYDIPDTATESFGIYGRIHTKDEEELAPGIFALGGFFRSRFQQGPYEFYFAPGFGFINWDLADTELLLGPSLAYGMLAELDPKLAVGIENHKLYSWFGEVTGPIADTFLVNLKFRL